MHNKNVIHRDLKPENVFIEVFKNGQVQCKIGDFGLSRLLNCQQKEDNGVLNLKTQVSTIAGTTLYMAPEILDHFNNDTMPP